MIRRETLDIDRLCVDARALAGEGTGIATYTNGLIAALTHAGRQVGLLSATGVSTPALRVMRACLPGPTRLAASGRDLTGRDIFRLAQVGFGMRRQILRLRAPGPPGIMHWTYPMPIMIEGWANLYTVHDTIPLHAPHLTPVDRDRHTALLAAIEPVAAKIVTVSDAARADILSVLGCRGERVVNCGQAISPEAVRDEPPPGYLSRGYLLFCGRIEPRKNLARLFAAYRASGTAMPLLLAGPLVDGSEEILRLARDQPGIRYLRYVDRAELIALIGHARALLLPSLAEGFGLPVAEAMMLGTPTLVSTDLALVETAGGASVVVDAEDEAGLAQALLRLATDDDLCSRLRELGRLRAKAFEPALFAAKLRAIHEAL